MRSLYNHDQSIIIDKIIDLIIMYIIIIVVYLSL